MTNDATQITILSMNAQQRITFIYEIILRFWVVWLFFLFFVCRSRELKLCKKNGDEQMNEMATIICMHKKNKATFIIRTKYKQRFIQIKFLFVRKHFIFILYGHSKKFCLPILLHNWMEFFDSCYQKLNVRIYLEL